VVCLQVLEAVKKCLQFKIFVHKTFNLDPNTISVQMWNFIHLFQPVIENIQKFIILSALGIFGDGERNVSRNYIYQINNKAIKKHLQL